MKKLIKRWKMDTPDFWKKVIYGGVAIGGIGGGLLLVEGLPLFLYELAKGMSTIGATSAVIAKFTVKNPEQL
jgi:hypothetical protein